MANVRVIGATGKSGDWFDYPAMRLWKSAECDAFGVHRLVKPDEEADVIIVASNWHYPPVGLSAMRDSVWRCPRTVVVNSADNPSPLLGGLCPSWRRDLGPAGVAAIGWCYFHPESAEVGLEEQSWTPHPRYLWTFRGSLKTHAIRAQLGKLSDPESLVEDTSANSQNNLMGLTAIEERGRFRRDYAALLKDSSFVVCPRGEGVSSMRIFEAMRAGRAPVILSDHWIAPPFVDWESCSLRVSEKAISELPDLLRETRNEAERMGKQARQEWERVLGPATLFHHTVEAALDLIARRQRSVAWQSRVRYLQIARPMFVREIARHAWARFGR